ncbi:MAG: hypothetical protein MK108_04140 [Mariniblastus sp.]|nr:hypothetical protein [Mariniblastus sp.]
MSEQAIESDNIDEIGQTSAESVESNESSSETKKTKDPTKSFNIYNAMMVVSLVCLSVAIGLMFVKLGEFGNVLGGEFPWRTSDAIINP